jgi:hypothetical protein
MLRLELSPSGIALLAAGLALATTAPARAADWYTGAATPKPADDWIVSLDASTTVTSTNSVFANVGGTVAVDGSLRQSGARIKVDAMAGTYEYKAASGAKIQADQIEGSAMLGYEWIWREAKLAGYIGLSLRNTGLSANDPDNQVVGTSYGLKTAVDFYARPTEKTMVSAYGSITTNDKAYFTRFRAGYRVGEGVYLGPEVAFLGNDFYNQWRAGIHLTGLALGPVQTSISAGYLYDRDQKGGAYGTIDVRAQF